MYGIAVEYVAAGDSSLPDPLERASCRAVLVRQPGYYQRLALMADAWRRVVDFSIFTDAATARAALAGDEWRTFAAAQAGCAAAKALLASRSA